MKYAGLLLFLLTFVLINSCCQKKLCIGVEDQNEIKLRNFTQSDVDSIVIKTYLKNSNFSNVVDSFNTVAVDRLESDSSLIIFLNSNLDLNLDYKITFTSIHKTYLLTQFAVRAVECNTCFPIGHEHVTVLDSYFVNGQKQTLGRLIITK